MISFCGASHCFGPRMRAFLSILKAYECRQSRSIRQLVDLCVILLRKLAGVDARSWKVSVKILCHSHSSTRRNSFSNESYYIKTIISRRYITNWLKILLEIGWHFKNPVSFACITKRFLSLDVLTTQIHEKIVKKLVWHITCHMLATDFSGLEVDFDKVLQVLAQPISICNFWLILRLYYVAEVITF